ncbi:MAG: TerB family tellurite resistance protein [Ferruginibacter sp.]
METNVKILTGISDEEKGAYLSAIASIATADSRATQTEIDHLTHLCEAADLSAEQQQLVLNAAMDPGGEGLLPALDLLKGTDLKYSLLTDLLAFAKSDGNYSEAEEHSVQKIADYLGVDETQFGLLDQVAQNAHTTSNNSEQVSANGLLGSLGDKLKASGIDGGGLLKGLVSIAAPLIISKMMNRNNSNTNAGNTGLGGLLGGGGLGSLFSMLSGGKGMSGAGGLLGKIFG